MKHTNALIKSMFDGPEDHTVRSEDWRVPKPGPPVRLAAGRKPFYIILFAVTTLWLLVMYNTLAPWAKSSYSTAWIIWVWLHIIAYTIAWFMTVWCYIIAWKVQPSVTPAGWTPDREAIDPLTPDHKIRYCDQCESWIPPRAYHCDRCKRCVLMKDQHSPWINGCVGYGNTKPYILFIWNLLVLVAMAQFMSFWWFLMSMIGYEFETCYWQSEMVCWISTLLSVSLLPLEILLGFLLVWHIRLSAFNVTNQEVVYWTHEVLNYNKYHKQEDEEPREWAYYGGWFYTPNMVNVFGYRAWLFPHARELKGDGTKWDLNPKWLKQNQPEEV